MTLPGVLVCSAGGSEKSKADVEVGVMGTGENAARGVDADSVANRSMVGGDAGPDNLPNLDTRKVTNSKKPQAKTSPAAILRERFLLIILQ